MTTRLALMLLCIGLVLPGAAAAAAPAATTPDPYLALLAGRWNLAGSLLGKPVRHHGEGRWVLQNGWLRFSIVDAQTPPAYEAAVYLGFDPKAGDYIAHWLDQFGAAGARVVAAGRRDGNTLVLLFPYTEGTFRDTFVLTADGSGGTLLIESREKDGHWSTFASYRLTRPHPAATGARAR